MNKSELNKKAYRLAQEGLGEPIKQAEKKLITLQKAAGVLVGERRPARSLKFTIRLNSLWRNEGEHSHEITARGQLVSLIKRAEDEYMHMNRRSDVQADYSVSLVVQIGKDDAVFIPLPETFWSMYKHQYKN